MDFTFKIIHYNKVEMFQYNGKRKAKKTDLCNNGTIGFDRQQGCDCLINRWNIYIPRIIKYTVVITVIIFRKK